MVGKSLIIRKFISSGICATIHCENIDYFMERARVRYLRTSCGISENERVSVANEWVFWYKNNECVNTAQSTFHAVICLFYTY